MTSLSAVPVLTILVWTPAIGAVLSLCLAPRARRVVSLAAASLALALGTWVWLGSGGGSPPGLRELHPWIPSLGISYELALDALGAALGVSIALVALLALLGEDPAEDGRRSVPLVLLAETALLGLVLARDVFLFLSFLGLGIFAGTGLITRSRAPRFFFFHSAGLGLATGFSLAWYHLAFVQSGFPTGEIARFAGLVTYPDFECRTFLLGAAAACCVAPLFPFGSWLQDSAEALPSSGRALFFGGFSLVAALILLRLVLPSVPTGKNECSGWVVVLAALSMIYAALVPYRGEPRRSFVPLLAGAQGLVVLGLLSGDPRAFGAGQLSVLSVGIAFSALAISSDGGENSEVVPTPLSKALAAILVAFVLWLPESSGLPSVLVILRSHWDRFPVATVLATLGAIGMAVRLVLAYPVLARAGAAQPRLKLLRVVPLLVWFFVASSSLAVPEAASPVEALSETEE
jgi:NADH-quinone oxidoreductase subunit M